MMMNATLSSRECREPLPDEGDKRYLVESGHRSKPRGSTDLFRLVQDGTVEADEEYSADAME